MTLCVICDILYKSQEGKKNKGHCKAFVAPVDVQLDCDDKTMVQPDILIVCDPDKLIKQCVFGAPDFVAEVLSKSTKNKDMNLKLMKYKRAGVREYWLIDTENEKVITYFLRLMRCLEFMGCRMWCRY